MKEGHEEVDKSLFYVYVLLGAGEWILLSGLYDALWHIFKARPRNSSLR